MKNILITGASRGIGAAAARLFAREGWDVAVNYNRSRGEALALAEELAGLGVRAVPIQGDISVPAEAEELVQAAELIGMISVVNSAAREETVHT